MGIKVLSLRDEIMVSKVTSRLLLTLGTENQSDRLRAK